MRQSGAHLSKRIFYFKLIGKCTDSLMVWKGEENSLTTHVSTKVKNYNNSKNCGELQDKKENLQ